MHGTAPRATLRDPDPAETVQVWDLLAAFGLRRPTGPLLRARNVVLRRAPVVPFAVGVLGVRVCQVPLDGNQAGVHPPAGLARQPARGRRPARPARSRAPRWSSVAI